MTPQQLKNSILQRAIEGRLVPQKAEEGTAKELLQKIQAEKAQLIAEKKIKKTKALPPISDEEIPFDIPDSWEWVRLDEISKQIGDIDHKMPTTVLEGIPYVSPLNFTDSGIDFESAKKISYEDYKRLAQKIYPERNDIIFPRYGTIGVIRQVDTDREFLASYSCCVIKVLSNFTDNKFIRYVLESPITKQEINRYINKTTQPNVGLKSIQQFLFPLPPLAEQRRIVAKIEELLPFIDKYDKAYTKLTEFNARFPEDMKKSILQYAIEGKLVEQRKEEGTADALLQQIQAEKKRLIEENKIKKTKSLPPITEEEIPFDIPEGWAWVRFGDITINLDSQRIPLSVKQREKLKKVYDYYGASGVIDKVDGYIFDKKLLLIGEDGANLLTRSRPIAFIAKGKYWVNNHAHIMDTYDNVHMEYLMYYINSISLAMYVTGTAQPKMNQAKMNSILVALPPLAEQKRIVAKIEELLPLCEQLIK